MMNTAHTYLVNVVVNNVRKCKLQLSKMECNYELHC